jgi:hypothetical protein
VHSEACICCFKGKKGFAAIICNHLSLFLPSILALKFIPLIFNTTSFITRRKASGASEGASYQLFLSELCELLGVEKPRPASDKVHEADYTFERPVEFNDGEEKITTNFIDMYKRHCFVLEAKLGADKAVITEAEILDALGLFLRGGLLLKNFNLFSCVYFYCFLIVTWNPQYSSVLDVRPIVGIS